MAIGDLFPDFANLNGLDYFVYASPGDSDMMRVKVEGEFAINKSDLEALFK